jgi:protocatechuate 3,4-dioxygenase beta subunit
MDTNRIDTDRIEPEQAGPAGGHRLTRRQTLLGLAGLAATAAGGGALARDADAAGTGPAGVASGAVRCVLTPELTEGPYYIAGEKVRRDITDGRPGTKLMLRTTVVDASTCKPIRGASVDVWHADASGVYSGFGDGASSQTFMRGVQKTDVRGLAVFKTVYPGWYPGRSVHIHVKVHLGGSVVHTGQLFFPEATTDVVYASTPYSARPGRTTRNTTDSIFVNGGPKGLLKLARIASGGWTGSITMGVHRS